MNTAALSLTTDLFGIYEMDESGMVFYYKGETRVSPNHSAPTIVGRNFFDDIAVFQNVSEFQRRFKNFIAGSHASDDFKFNFHLPEKVLEGRVKMMRVRERQNDKSNDLVIVDIRQVLI